MSSFRVKMPLEESDLEFPVVILGAERIYGQSVRPPSKVTIDV